MNQANDEKPTVVIDMPWTWVPLRNIRVGDSIKLGEEEWVVTEESVYTNAIATKSIRTTTYGQSQSETHLELVQGLKRYANVNVDTGIITYRDTPGGSQDRIVGLVGVKWAEPDIVEMFRSR